MSEFFKGFGMTSLHETRDYYKQMFELQQKLRKSEEERIRLEERFKILMQESRTRHNDCINRLQARYIEFCEEQRARDARNHKLLGALDKVDSGLAFMTAKVDRLNILRKQSEVHLRQAYATRRPLAGSVTGDSGIASRNEDGSTTKNMNENSIARPELTISPIQSSARNDKFGDYYNKSIHNKAFDSMSYISMHPRSTSQSFPRRQIHSNSPKSTNMNIISNVERMNSPFRYRQGIDEIAPIRTSPRYSIADDFSSRFEQQPYTKTSSDGFTTSRLLSQTIDPDYLNYSSRYSPTSIKQPVEEIPPSSTKEDLNNLIQRIEDIIPSESLGSKCMGKETRQARLENELEQCIKKIKNLYKELEAESLTKEDEEEHDREQNTSGDLLNVSLSEDAGLDLSSKDDEVGDEKKVLAGDTDLATMANKDPNDKTNVSRETNRDDLSKDCDEFDSVLVSEIQNQVFSGTKDDVIETPNVDDAYSRLFVATEMENQQDETVQELQPWDLDNFRRPILDICDNDHVEENKDHYTEKQMNDYSDPGQQYDYDYQGNVDNPTEAYIQYDNNHQQYDYNELTNQTYANDSQQYQYDDRGEINQIYPQEANMESSQQEYPSYDQDSNQQYQIYDPNQSHNYVQDGSEWIGNEGYSQEQYANDTNYYENIENTGEMYENESKAAIEETFVADESHSQYVEEHREEKRTIPEDVGQSKKKKDVIKSLLDSDTDSTIEQNRTNTESDFDIN